MTDLQFIQPVTITVFPDHKNTKRFEDTKNGKKCLICPTNADTHLKTELVHGNDGWFNNSQFEKRKSLVIDGKVIPLIDQAKKEHFHFTSARDFGEYILINFSRFGQSSFFSKTTGHIIPLMDEKGVCRYTFSLDHNYGDKFCVIFRDPSRRAFYYKLTLGIVLLYDTDENAHFTCHDSHQYDDLVTIQFKEDGAWYFFNRDLESIKITGENGTAHHHCYVIHNYGKTMEIKFSKDAKAQYFTRTSLQQLIAA